MNRHEFERNFLALTFLAAAIPATLLACAWIYFILSLDHYTSIHRVAGVSVGLLIILHSVKTAGLIFNSSVITGKGETFIHIAGLVLTIIGSAWLVWAIHLGLTSGDWEYYGVLSAGATTAQGSISLLMIRQRSSGLV